MRKSRFTESQIVAILKEGEAGVPVPEILRKHGISRPTYFLWKSKYGGARVKDLARLKELEQENAKLERMYAELAPENAAIRERVEPKVVSPSTKRETVEFLAGAHRLSVRPAGRF